MKSRSQTSRLALAGGPFVGLEAISGYWVGVDEAGRGPLAGPVFAAAVILPTDQAIEGLRDSKKLSQATRGHLAELIRSKALAYGVAFSSVEEIDTINILQASLLAMRRAVSIVKAQLKGALLHYAVDGNQDPQLDGPTRCIVGGDDEVAEIAAASILAKTSRDAWMIEADQRFPGYDFARHKGYSTPKHRALIALLGPSAIHRRSFSWK